MSGKKHDAFLRIKGTPSKTTTESDAQALALPLRNPGPKLTLNPNQPANTTPADKCGKNGDKK